MIKICEGCKSKYEPTRTIQRFCNTVCSKNYYYKLSVSQRERQKEARKIKSDLARVTYNVNFKKKAIPLVDDFNI